MQTVTVKDTRMRLADLINQVEVARKQFIITKFGKPKAMLVPIATSFPNKKASGIAKSFGIWKDRKDIKDTNRWVANLRKKISLRRE